MCHHNITICFIDAFKAAMLLNTTQRNTYYIYSHCDRLRRFQHTRKVPRSSKRSVCWKPIDFIYLAYFGAFPHPCHVYFFSRCRYILSATDFFWHVNKLTAYNFFLLWTFSLAVEDFLLPFCLTWLCDIIRHLIQKTGSGCDSDLLSF